MNYFVYQGLLFTSLLIVTYKRIQQKKVIFEIAWNLCLIIMTAGFLGGRLFHILFEYPDLYWQSPMQILRFWEGGFVFFGGMLLALIGSAIYLWLKKENFLYWADFFAPIVALGYAFGRLGCLLGGCCYGQFCDLAWAINGRHPTQIYAFICEIILFLFLLKKEKQNLPVGTLFSYWLIGHGLGRLFMESFRADFRGFQPLGFSLGSWFSLFCLAVGFGLFLKTTTAVKSR